MYLLGFALCAGAVQAADFSDNFADRPAVTGTSLVQLGNNASATIEPGEPMHASKPGGHSMWVSWVAPTNGLVTLSTVGSTFDTLLAVYTLEAGSGPVFSRLREAAEGDDVDTSIFATLQFSARAGLSYQIAVDGFAGATGDIRLQLDLLSLAAILPSVARRPADIAVRAGDTLILTMDIDGQSAEAFDLQWYFNNQRLVRQDRPSLIITNFQGTNVGQYKIRLEAGDAEFFSAPIEVQINSEGQTNALARNKLEDAADSGLTPGGGSGLASGAKKSVRASLGGGVARGYNGYQIFNTTFATRDPLEPMHCGVAGGPTYWFSYQPPANGTLHLDTVGSSYDTLLAVYTYDPPLTGYAGLIPVACDNNSGGNGTSSLNFEAASTRAYFIVVDGVNNARGLARLNWSLSTSNPPPPTPVITRQPRSLTAAAGTTIALDVVAAGVDPKRYQWFRNGAILATQTNASIALPSISPGQSGVYVVTVSNLANTATSAVAVVEVISSPRIRVDHNLGTAILAFPATRGFQYRIDAAEQLQTNGWSTLTDALTDDAGMIWITNSMIVPSRFYRIVGP